MRTDTPKDTSTDTEETFTTAWVAAHSVVMNCSRKMNERRRVGEDAAKSRIDASNGLALEYERITGQPLTGRFERETGVAETTPAVNCVIRSRGGERR
jgi:hypothetical protein